MHHHYHQAQESLKGYIRTILLVENAADTSELPMLPQGTPTLLCVMEKKVEVEAEVELYLFAKTLDMGVLKGRTNFSFIASFFKPFITAPLFGISAKELAEGHISGKGTGDVRRGILSEVANATTLEERLFVLQGFLQGLAAKNQIACRIIEIATDWMVANPSTEVLSDLLQELGISERTLQRIFQRYLGHTPTKFRRLCQFYSAFEQVRSEEFDLLSDVAYEQGYADQSHFIRAFKEFTDKSPQSYLKKGLNPSKG